MDDFPKPPPPSVSVWLDHDAFANAEVHSRIKLVIAGYGGPLERAQYEVKIMEDRGKPRDSVFVSVEGIYGMGDKRTRELFDRIEHSVTSAMKPSVDRAQKAAAELLATMRR